MCQCSKCWVLLVSTIRESASFTNESLRAFDALVHTLQSTIKRRSGASWAKALIGGLGDHELVLAGNSLKFSRIVQGRVDIHGDLSPICERDTGPACARLLASVDSLSQVEGSALVCGEGRF